MLVYYLYLNLLVFLESEISQKMVKNKRGMKNTMLIIWRHFIWLYRKFKMFYELSVNELSNVLRCKIIIQKSFTFLDKNELVRK